MVTTTVEDELERRLRAEMVALGKRMYAAGYIAGTDGNLSARLGEAHLLVTPSGVAKGALSPEDLVLTDLDGKALDGAGRPSSELKLHLAVYRLRPEVNAVVHAHPPAAVAHSLAGVSLATTVLPETVLTLGAIASVDYDTPGTAELADRVAAVLRCHDAVVMARHGTVTLGRDLLEAYHRLESLEHTARTLYMARTLGRVEPLPADEVERLHEVAAEAGTRRHYRADASSGSATTPPNGCRPDESPAVHEDRDRVEEVVRRVLRELGI